MKKLWNFFAVCGLVLIAAMIAGCNGLLEGGAQAAIFRDSNSLLGGSSTTTSTGAGGVGGGVITSPSGGHSIHWDSSRIIASNTRPVFVATVYGNNATGDNGRYVDHNTPEAGHWFENDISPRVMWGLIPENLKKYSVLGIHANAPNNGQNAQNKQETKRFYDEQLTICDELQAPAMIVVMAARGGYGSSNYSFNGITPDNEDDKKWIKDMVAKHPSLKGFITSEHYWTGYGSGDDPHHGKWLRAAATLDKTLLIHDKVFDSSNYFSDAQFKQYALEHGDEHLILGTKYTSAGDQHEAHSYAQGAWLTGVSHAYGGLIDTWSWAERGYGEPMTNSKDSYAGSGQYRYKSNGVTQYPGGVLASFMMQMYLNGATVFNFEAPWVICASEGKASTHMVDVIAPFFDWMAENPAPTEADIRSLTKYYFTGTRVNPGNIYPPTFDPGNNDASYKTGRYGLVPFVSSNLFATPEVVETQLKKLGGFAKASGAKVTSSDSKFADNWDDIEDGYYEDPSLPKTRGGDGDTFAAIRNIGGADTYYFYNTHIGGKVMTDESHVQYARIPIGTEIECDIENDSSTATKFMEVGLTPHTAVIVKREATDTLRIWMCNARVDTSTSPAFDGTKTGEWNDGRVGMDYWITQNLCIGGSHTAQNQQRWERDTKFYFDGVTSVECQRVDGQSNSSVSANGTTVTAHSNGWLEFVVTVK